jgi:hypothetical protein
LGVRYFGLSFEGIIEPVPEVAIRKEVQTQQDYQSAERQIEFRTELEIP